MKWISIAVFCSYSVVIAQSGLSEKSLRKCLPFDLHPIQKIERMNFDLANQPHPSYDTIYSDPNTRVKLTFGGDKPFGDNNYVFLSSVSGNPDSAFLQAGRDIICCSLVDNEDAIDWFEHMSVVMDSVLSTRQAVVKKVFGHVEIRIHINSDDRSVRAFFMQYPMVVHGVTR